MWEKALQTLAQQVDLNPRSDPYTMQPRIFAQATRARSRVVPDDLRVAGETDIPSGALMVATGINRADLTGLIACPQPCNVQYAAAYCFYHPELTKDAASGESQAENFSALLEYEFENHILATLGYDLRWR
jgi:hypothetical protein